VLVDEEGGLGRPVEDAEQAGGTERRVARVRRAAVARTDHTKIGTRPQSCPGRGS